MPFTFILDDPLGNSYLQNLYAPEADPNMTVETYDRTFEQNEDLGLNDMKLEGYDGGEEGEKMDTESTTLGDATVTGALDVVEEEPAEPTSTITQ